MIVMSSIRDGYALYLDGGASRYMKFKGHF